MDIWFVGVPLVVEGREIGWMPEGCFLTEKEASGAAKENEFILCAGVGNRFPAMAVDAEKLYFPKSETWEESALYRMRNGQ